jgi:hypothetical protein
MAVGNPAGNKHWKVKKVNNSVTRDDEARILKLHKHQKPPEICSYGTATIKHPHDKNKTITPANMTCLNIN